jgi:hypothetical protein
MNRAPSAAEMNDGVDSLNEMLQAWALDGMDLGLETLVQTDEDLLDAAFVKGIRYNLAVELAGSHGILNELPGSVVGEAEDAEGANPRSTGGREQPSLRQRADWPQAVLRLDQ